VVFSGRQALEVGRAIADMAREKQLVAVACAVMPEHVHLVVLRHTLGPAKIVGGCRARASRRLHDAELWPRGRPIWGEGSWAVALETPDDVRTRIRYVEQNPLAAGLPPQRWSFVTEYP
jgi:REP element-mobilizing transposase RayT